MQRNIIFEKLNSDVKTYLIAMFVLDCDFIFLSRVSKICHLEQSTMSYC